MIAGRAPRVRPASALPDGYFQVVLYEYFPGHADRTPRDVLVHRRRRGWTVRVYTPMGRVRRVAATLAELYRKIEDLHMEVTPELRGRCEELQIAAIADAWERARLECASPLRVAPSRIRPYTR